jgi:hypothetical protein
MGQVGRGTGSVQAPPERQHMMRECGDCQLCCKLLPIPPLSKPANQRCKFQKFGKGCTVYHKPGSQFPIECGLWNCRWLVSDDTDDLSRPDRSHYVIDLVPDFITATMEDKPQHIPVVQIWNDPAYPDAHRDPALRRYLFRRAEEGMAGLIRFDARKALVIFAPPWDVNGQWHEITSGMTVGPGHSAAQVQQVLSQHGD